MRDTQSDVPSAQFVPAPEASAAGASAVNGPPLAWTTREPEAGLNALLDELSRRGASDLFFAATERAVSVSMRHLGVVRPLAELTTELGRRYVNHLKAMAGMDLTERRHPLDGRWIHRPADGETLDLRINTLATLHGEDVAIKLLHRHTRLLNLEALGLVRPQLNLLLALLTSPSGLLLVTGPTGSGKTTTLYACLNHLNDGTRKINTIEDPIEYEMEGVRQSQINPKINLDFPELLRSVLRQSPDVIMIGEIRDPVTAATAVRAANSGHLVCATLHAPVAAGAIESMLGLGVHPHFLSTAIRGVLAQRLVRTLCPACKFGLDLSESLWSFQEVRSWLGQDEGKQIFTAAGCDVCGGSGFTERTGVFEVLGASPEIRRMIARGRSAREIEDQALTEGMLDFRRGALLKVAQGTTNIEEVLRAVPAEYLEPDRADGRSAAQP
jgi:type II secretory ATPase GspE/PulE/Tfp pilus assembly ATPase PilB-like protein